MKLLKEELFNISFTATTWENITEKQNLQSFRIRIIIRQIFYEGGGMINWGVKLCEVFDFMKWNLMKRAFFIKCAAKVTKLLRRI